MTSFKSPKDNLGNLSADTAATVVEAAADIALVIDGRGVIQDVAFGRIDLAPELAGVSRWSGRRFTAVVTEASQPKVEMLLNEAASGVPTQWRQLGHPDAQGGEVPVLYCAVQIHKNGRVLALGRDMRALATLQQRLVEAQMSMERDYSRLRHAETRYRVLFQTSSEPALVLDAATDRVVEANPAAARLFGETSGRMIGRNFPAGLDAESAQALQSLSTGIRAGLNVEPTRVRFADGEEMSVATSMFRQGASAFYMLRFTPANLGNALTRDANSARLVEFSRRATDGIVVVGPEGRIQSANSAFLQMTQVMNEDQVRGELIERWLGRTGVDVNVMIANLRQHESVTLFATVMRGDFGTTTEVEISGASLGGDPPSYGLAIRNVSHRIGGEAPQTPKQLPQSVEQLKELIGRVSLKDMVRDTTDMIEKMCIQAALELTGDNRASAAEMLGLSRQSLYVKLRRYGMAEDTVDAESEGAMIATLSRPAPSALLELLKPITWFPPMWAYGCGVVSSGLPVSSRWHLVVAGVVLAGPMVCATSQAVNDWFDRHVDAINEPNRPIPSGRMPGRWGLYVAIVWSVLSLLVGATLGVWGFAATVVGLALAWAYSAPPIRLKKNGWWGNAAVGACYEGLPWFTGAAVMAGALPDWRIVLLAALYSVGAHGIMTLNDFKSIEGDKRMGIGSLPVRLGAKNAAWLACFVMAVPQAVVIEVLFVWGQGWHALAVAVSLVVQIYCMSVMLKAPREKAPWYNSTGVSLYVLGMLVSAFAVSLLVTP